MPLLAIETSCDEICAAVRAEGRLLSNVIASQEIHQPYGGVVPELGQQRGFKLFYPPPVYCTDNAAMIARAAEFYFARDHAHAPRLPRPELQLSPQPGLRLLSIA